MLNSLTIPLLKPECGYARLIGYNGHLSRKRAYSINRLYSRLNLKIKQGILPDMAFRHRLIKYSDFGDDEGF